jgi:hypothetical protein
MSDNPRKEEGIWKSFRDGCLNIFVVGLLLKGVLSVFFPNFLSHFSETSGTYQTTTWNTLAPAVALYDGRPGISFEDQLKFAEVVGIPQYEVIEGRPIKVSELTYSQLEKALDAYSSNIYQE